MSDTGTPREPSGLVRPRQVTLAGWMIVVGSVAVVLTVFQQVSGLHTLETRRTLEQALSEPPMRGLGLTVEGLRTWMRVFAMIAGACATAAAILGYQVLRRSRSARVALAVLVVPLFVTGITTGGLLSSVVAAAALMLWLQPARDWFDGKQPAASRPIAGAPGAPRPGRVPLEEARAAQSSAPPSQAPGLGQPQVGQPQVGQPQVGQPQVGQPQVGQPQVGQPGQPGHGTPYAAQPQHPSYAPVRRPDLPRPGQLTTACVLTWVGSALATLAAVAYSAVLIADPGVVDQVIAENPRFAEQGVTAETVVVASVVLMGGFVLWCVGAAVLAILVWRRVRWAHLLLAISAGLALAVCVVGLLANALLLVPLAVCATGLALLVRPESRAWL